MAKTTAKTDAVQPNAGLDPQISDPTGYKARKAARRQYYHDHVHGKKLVTCTACSGSGYYDNDGSPPCGACNGQGKVREP